MPNKDKREDDLVKISVSLPQDLLAKLDARAEAEHRSRSNAVAVILRDRLEAEAKGGAA